MTPVPCELFTKHAHLFLLFILTFTSTCWEDHCSQFTDTQSSESCRDLPKIPQLQNGSVWACAKAIVG